MIVNYYVAIIVSIASKKKQNTFQINGIFIFGAFATINKKMDHQRKYFPYHSYYHPHNYNNQYLPHDSFAINAEPMMDQQRYIDQKPAELQVPSSDAMISSLQRMKSPSTYTINSIMSTNSYSSPLIPSQSSPYYPVYYPSSSSVPQPMMHCFPPTSNIPSSCYPSSDCASSHTPPALQMGDAWSSFDSKSKQIEPPFSSLSCQRIFFRPSFILIITLLEVRIKNFNHA